MATTPSQFIVRARAIILDAGELLVVRHAHNPSYAALPGGHLDFGESPRACIERELYEELGVHPTIGRLLYVNTFTIEQDGVPTQPVEFFFEVTNTSDFRTLGDDRSHAHELAGVEWVAVGDPVTILPAQIAIDHVAGLLLSDEPRFITH